MEITTAMIEAMKAAVEGECDGLAIDDDHAKAILQYVLPAAPVAVKVRSISHELENKLRSALRFSASRSVLTAEDERKILSALSPAPVSAEPLALAISRDRLREKIASAPDLEVEVRSLNAEPQPDLFELLQVAFRRGANWVYINGSAEGLNKAAYDYADYETSQLTKEERARAALADQKGGAA